MPEKDAYILARGYTEESNTHSEITRHVWRSRTRAIPVAVGVLVGPGRIGLTMQRNTHFDFSLLNKVLDQVPYE